MALIRNKMKLRVQITPQLKFYVVIDSDTSIFNLKQKISTCAHANYNFPISSFILKSIDGFDILDSYSIKDILEDDQIVVVDLFSAFDLKNNTPNSIFSTNENYVNMGTEKKKNEISISVNRNSERPIRPISSQSKQPIAASTNNKKIEPVKKIQVAKRQEIESISTEKNEEEPVDMKKSALSSYSRFLAQKSEEDSSGSDNVGFPSGFKGFAVKKSDFPSIQPVSSTSGNTFKSVKRKKEEEAFDLL